MDNLMYNGANKNNNGGKTRHYYHGISHGEFTRKVKRIKLKFATTSILTCAIILSVSIFCIKVYAKDLESQFESQVSSRVASQVEEEIASLEQLKIVIDKTHIDEIKNVDFTQLTKTPLLKMKEELEVLVECYGKLNESNPETYGEIYNEIIAVYNECNTVLNDGTYQYPYSDKELALMAKAIMREQGDNRSPDEAQMLVGCVILNRQANGGISGKIENPTILDVLQEPGQYGHGVSVNYRWNMDMSDVTDKVWENARRVLEREYTAPSNVVFQATFKQGTGVYKQFENEGYNNTTYFCYGNV